MVLQNSFLSCHCEWERETNKHIYDVDLFDIDLSDIQRMLHNNDKIPDSFKSSIDYILELRKH